jgi:hypothetical protein
MSYVEYTTKSGKTGLRRLNKNTGKLFKRGDTEEDGSIFVGYDSNLKLDGTFIEKWQRPAGYNKKLDKQRNKTTSYKKYSYSVFTRTCYNKKHYCAKNNLPYDLTIEYLKEIYPDNNTCPVFNIIFDDSIDGSPQLDRIVPEDGYIKGNVVWICSRANRLKSNAKLNELKAIVQYMEKHVS